MTTTSLKATDTGPALRLLSLGAGVQSTTVLLLACEGEIPRFDVALFADTGWEPRAVYTNLDRLAAHAERHGIPVRQVSAGNIRADALDPRHRFVSMPLHTLNPDGSRGLARRQCTNVLSSRCRAVSSVSNVDICGLVATLETSPDWVSLSCRVDGWFGWCFYVLPMRTQRVISPSTGRVWWTVVGPDLMPVEPVERFLAYLAATERSPLTARTYAHDLAVFFRFLAERGLAWDKVSLEDLAQYIFWLRRPAAEVVVLDLESAGRASTTVNRMLSAVSAFYGHHARAGVAVADQLTTWRRIARRDYKPFLHHITKGCPVSTSALRLRTTRRLPKTLTVEQVQTLLDACGRLRDRFLFALLYETGMRVGQALGLRHEDMRTWERIVAIVPREGNANEARAKTRREHEVHVSAELCWLFSDYMHAEYGDLDSDYVFVNLWGGQIGTALRYTTVADLVDRLRRRTGIGFHLHQLRHTHATELLRGGVRIEVASKRLTHASTQTTEAFYDHLTVEDLRPEIEAFWTARGNAR